MPDSGTLPAYPLCGQPIIPFGEMGHTFVAEDLGESICVECARKVAPSQVTIAEEMERRWSGGREPERGS